MPYFLRRLSFYLFLIVLGKIIAGSYFLYCFYQIPPPPLPLIVEHPPIFDEEELTDDIDPLLHKIPTSGAIAELEDEEPPIVQIAEKKAETKPAPLPAITENLPLIDKVLVFKSARKLHLLADKKIVKTYSISLGKNPIGHKQKEGDMRTPEGLYWLDWRKKSTKYNLSIHISYPSWRDQKRAEQNNIEHLGGMIMLHGTPISNEFNDSFLHGKDWTDGCIALSNKDMQEVWNLVPNDTLIEIKP